MSGGKVAGKLNRWWKIGDKCGEETRVFSVPGNRQTGPTPGITTLQPTCLGYGRRAAGGSQAGSGTREQTESTTQIDRGVDQKFGTRH